MDSRPPLHIRYRADEPAYAIFNRLALRHGTLSVKEFCSIWRLPHWLTELGSGRGVLQVVKLTGFDEGKIKRSTPCLEAQEWVVGNEFIGSRIPKSLLCGTFPTLDRGRACPLCIAEDFEVQDGPLDCRPYRRFWWDIGAISVCPQHNVTLVKKCEKCGRWLEAKFMSPAYCACGAAIAHFACNSMPAQECEADRYIIGRLTGSGASTAPFLDHLSLKGAIDVMQAVGLSLLPSNASSNKSSVEKARAPTLGYNAFATWPKNLDEILDEIASIALRTSDHKYGQLGEWIERIPLGSELKQFKPLLADHWRRRRPVHIVAKTPDQDLEELRRHFGLTESQMCMIALQFGFRKGSPEDRSTVDLYFEQREAYQEVRALLHKTLSYREVRGLLRIDEYHLSRFEEENILRPIYRGEKADAARYLKSDVSSLLERMRGHRPVVRQKSPGLAAVLEFHRIFQINPDFVILALAKGSIDAAALLYEERGIPAILLDVSDVRSLWLQTVGRPSRMSWRFADSLVMRYIPVQSGGRSVQICGSL